MQPFSIVVAVDAQLGIGKNGTLPWRLKEDMKHFRELTTGNGNNAVIMGRKTWDSIPEKFRPLPNRTNIILSKNKEGGRTGAVTTNFFEGALGVLCDKKFVIGGGEIYSEAIKHPLCSELWITRVDASFNCDVTFPHYEDRFQLESVVGRFAENGVECAIERWIQR